MFNLSLIKPLIKQRGLKIKDFCTQIGMTEQGFAKLIRTNSTKIETLQQIADALDVPLTVFLEGNEEARPMQSVSVMNVPVVPIYAQAGYLEGYGDMEYIDTLPTMPIVTDRQYKGNYRIFEVAGDSMYDGSVHSLMSGDKLLAREIRQDFWRSRLHFRNWYFVIVHRTDGILVKQIVDHDVDTGVITCHSLNDMFDDFKLNLSDIAQLFNVVSIVQREMRM